MPNNVNKLQSYVLRGTNQQSATPALLWQPPGYTIRSASQQGLIGRGTSQTAPGDPTTYTQREGILLKHFELHQVGTAGAVGIGGRIANRFWKAGKYDGTTFTDDTTDAQDDAGGDFEMHAVDDANDGFVIYCPVLFSWVSVNVSTACTNAGGTTVPDHTISYSDSAGTAWTSLASTAAYTSDLITTNAVIAVGERNLVFEPPTDWGKTTGLTGIPNGYYALRFTAAQHETSDVALTAHDLEIGILYGVKQLAQYGIWEVDFGSYPGAGYRMHECDGLVAFFDVEDNLNRVYADVETI